MKKALFVFVALATTVAALGGGGAAAYKYRSKWLKTAAAAEVKASVPLPLKAKPTAEPSHTFIGVLLPPQMADVSSKADGALLDVPVKVGQRVRKNDLLASFDRRDTEHQLAAAVGQLRAAQGAAASAGADLGAARGRAARRTATVDVGGKKIPLVSGEEAQQSVFDAHGAAGRAATAAGQVAEQKAKIAALKLALENTELRAPFDGVVTGTYFEPGNNVHAKDTVVRVVGGGNGLRVRMAVPEEDGVLARAGNAMTLSLDDGTSLQARLERVSPEIDATTRAFFVEGDVDIHGDFNQVVALAGRTVRATIKP